MVFSIDFKETGLWPGSSASFQQLWCCIGGTTKVQCRRAVEALIFFSLGKSPSEAVLPELIKQTGFCCFLTCGMEGWRVWQV